MPDGVEREAARDGEKESLCRADRLSGPGLPNAKVGLLHKIVDLSARRGKGAVEISPELAVMRVHLLGKPAPFLDTEG